jgi:SNF2 family DNA or RNA helicase
MVPESKALASYWKFYEAFVDYEFVERPSARGDKGMAKYREIHGGKNLDAFAELMSNFGIQRSKDVVAPQLPALIETDLPVELPVNSPQGKMYKALRKKNQVEVTVGDAELVITNVLTRITRMEQVLSCPWEYQEGVNGIKLDWLLEWAEAYPFPAVIATRFKSTAKHIAKLLDAGSPITGDLPLILRQDVISKWEDGDHKFLVGTIATIGTGLNLQYAHAMVAFDQVHDSIHMEQLKHRIHRINSEHPVQIIYPYVFGTTNEIVHASFKQRLSEMDYVRRCIEYLQSQDEEEA